MTKSILIFSVAFSVAMGALLQPVLGHSWYPAYCCSDEDCKPVDCGSLTETNEGITYRRDGKDYKFTKSQISPSQDHTCHACIYKDTPMCVFTLQSF